MLWIHIGLRKAGSSTLQSFLRTNQEALEPLGLRYPTLGLLGNAHHDLVSELKGRPPRKENYGWAALPKAWRVMRRRPSSVPKCLSRFP